MMSQYDLYAMLAPQSSACRYVHILYVFFWACAAAPPAPACVNPDREALAEINFHVLLIVRGFL